MIAKAVARLLAIGSFRILLAVACRIILDSKMGNESHEWERDQGMGPIREHARDHAMSDRREDLLGVGKASTMIVLDDRLGVFSLGEREKWERSDGQKRLDAFEGQETNIRAPQETAENTLSPKQIESSRRRSIAFPVDHSTTH